MEPILAARSAWRSARDQRVLKDGHVIDTMCMPGADDEHLLAASPP